MFCSGWEIFRKMTLITTFSLSFLLTIFLVKSLAKASEHHTEDPCPSYAKIDPHFTICLNSTDIKIRNYEYPELEELPEPEPEKCRNRKIHFISPLGTQYYFSWLAGITEQTWIGARKVCRKMCMDLVALETVAENKFIKDFVARLKIDEVWTAGRLCNFKGCEYHRNPRVWPRSLFGWFWASTWVPIAPFIDATRTDWFIGENERQPDNKSYRESGRTEACLAVVYNDTTRETRWFDEVCEYWKPFLCEDNVQLLEKVGVN